MEALNEILESEYQVEVVKDSLSLKEDFSLQDIFGFFCEQNCDKLFKNQFEKLLFELKIEFSED